MNKELCLPDWPVGPQINQAYARDYDEGLHGPVYRVCGVCQKRQEAEARAELDSYDDGYFDDEDLP